MTTLYHDMVKCSVCGKESQQIYIGSTNCFGSPDLDLRPAEMQRSTMAHWSEECPHCGYVASCLDEPTTLDAAWFEREVYKSANHIAFKSSLSKLFYKQYMIALEENRTEDAFDAAVCAAWACDDRQDEANAVLCRKLALDLVDKVIESLEDPTNLLFQKVDLLRRSGQFDRVVSEFGHTPMPDELLQDILDYQIEKAKQCDDGCYTVQDVREWSRS